MSSPTVLHSPLATVSGNSPAKAIVFFDGVCALCSASVDFWMRRDPTGRLAFAPLQGETAARLLPQALRENLHTMVLRTEQGENYVRSAAAIRIMSRLQGGWPLLAGLLWLIPLPLRDLGYRLVAASRYRLFGRRETCRLAGPGESDRLLP